MTDWPRKRDDHDEQIDSMRYAIARPLYRWPLDADTLTGNDALDALQHALAASGYHQPPPPPPAFTVTVPPEALERLRAELGRIFADWRAALAPIGRVLAELAPAFDRLAKLAAEIGAVEYQCREERRQHRRNPSPASLMHSAYRARRRGRW